MKNLRHHKAGISNMSINHKRTFQFGNNRRIDYKYFPKNNPSIKTNTSDVLPYELLRRFFLGKFHQIQYSSLRLFLKDYQPCTTVSCVCVCVCMWHSLNFNEAVSEINSGFADKLCIQKMNQPNRGQINN